MRQVTRGCWGRRVAAASVLRHSRRACTAGDSKNNSYEGATERNTRGTLHTPPPHAPVVAGGSAQAAAAAPTHCCPECGKLFYQADNLHQHRRTRHHVLVATPAEQTQAAQQRHGEELTAQLRELQAELVALRAQVQAARQGADTPRASSASSSSSAVVAGSPGTAPTHFTAALPTKATRVMTAQELRALCHRHNASNISSSGDTDDVCTIGTNMSVYCGIGVVWGVVKLGTLHGFRDAESKNDDDRKDGTAPRVLEFVLETHGHRSRRPGKQRMFRNRTTVRCIFDQRDCARDGGRAAFSVAEGDVLHVMGHYARHASFDVVSKQIKENVVVEADYVGLVKRREAAAATAASSSGE